MPEYTRFRAVYTFLCVTVFIAVIPLLGWYERTTGITPALSLTTFLLGIIISIFFIPACLYLDCRDRPDKILPLGRTKTILILLVSILATAAAVAALICLTRSTPQTCIHAVVSYLWGTLIIAVPALFILKYNKIRQYLATTTKKQP